MLRKSWGGGKRIAVCAWPERRHPVEGKKDSCNLWIKLQFKLRRNQLLESFSKRESGLGLTFILIKLTFRHAKWWNYHVKLVKKTLKEIAGCALIPITYSEAQEYLLCCFDAFVAFAVIFVGGGVAMGRKRKNILKPCILLAGNFPMPCLLSGIGFLPNPVKFIQNFKARSSEGGKYWNCFRACWQDTRWDVLRCGLFGNLTWSIVRTLYCGPYFQPPIQSYRKRSVEICLYFRTRKCLAEPPWEGGAGNTNKEHNVLSVELLKCLQQNLNCCIVLNRCLCMSC